MAGIVRCEGMCLARFLIYTNVCISLSTLTGTASGQASLGAGSSIGVSSINVEEISDLSDDDDW